jgi:hypothetical protein
LENDLYRGPALKKIYIFLNLDVIEAYPGNRIFPVSHDSVIREMERGADVIYTHDPSFFNFENLEKGYDVTVLRRDGAGWKGIILSGLLDQKDVRYIDKEMRLGNNAYKMLTAGAFEFQPINFKFRFEGLQKAELENRGRKL